MKLTTSLNVSYFLSKELFRFKGALNYSSFLLAGTRIPNAKEVKDLGI